MQLGAQCQAQSDWHAPRAPTDVIPAPLTQAERAQRRLVKEQLDATLAAAESARAAVAEPAAAQAASVVQSSGGAAEPSGEADGDAAPAAAADEALAACQGEATEAAPGEPAAGVTNATPAAAAAVAAVAAADAAEVARLERRARDLRQRLAAHTAALRALLDLQQQLEPLRLDAAVATDEESSLCERRVAAILSGGRAEPAEGEEEGEGAPLAHVLWSHALSLGLAPWQAFASLLSAAAALRARAERLRMRGEEAEAEVSLQRRLGAVAAEEAAAKEAAAEGLRRELAAAKVRDEAGLRGAGAMYPCLMQRECRARARYHSVSCCTAYIHWRARTDRPAGPMHVIPRCRRRSHC